MHQYEKLGSFFLGKHFDVQRKQTTDDLLLYDAKDLTTHAVCVGMTGSGKTGLCVSLLEEAALDGIPALVIDPKGDLGNLLLTFPGLSPEEFRPWVNPDEARRKDMTVEAYAAEQAALWREGLASWGQSGDRIRKLRAAADFAVYTPGSEAGLPISILDSFAAPPPEVRADPDGMRDRVTSTTTGLLGLLGLQADPIRSREHILVATIMDRLWREGRDLDLAGLIRAIQSPPVERVGVLELESFYPAQERFELAMRLNSLLAAPGFQAWLTGEPLDVQNLLYTPEGKPRVAVFSIAHLSDGERMFFVSLLLNQTLGWMRTRPGTTTLRSLLYMDEIHGFIPPTAEPPSKKPFLTLLKQARAYGLGVVLATQNPVDLDYKGLSNAGTWLLGRLQTERDKLRVLEGLEGVAAGGSSFDRGDMDRLLAGLGKRVFLMHNVHEDRPVLFHTRWAMSYLCGPLTREQIKRLTRDRPRAATPPAPAGRAAPGAAPPDVSLTAARPLLSPRVPQVFIPSRDPAEDGEPFYEPRLLGLGRVQYVDRKTKRLKHAEDVALLLPLGEGTGDVDWSDAVDSDLCQEELERDPDLEAAFGPVPAAATEARSYARWRKAFADTLYRGRSLDLHESPSLGLISEPGEAERDFRVRLADHAREKRDRMAEKLRKKYARRLARLEERIRKSQQSVEREKQQASGQKVQTAISFGATLLSAFLGRKKLSYGTLGRATTTMRGMGRAAKEGQDVKRAEANVAALQRQLAELNQELESEIDLLEDRFDPLSEELATTALRPRRTDVDVRLVALAWAPCHRGRDGTITSLCD
jgi:hypothetical protein